MIGTKKKTNGQRDKIRGKERMRKRQTVGKKERKRGRERIERKVKELKEERERKRRGRRECHEKKIRKGKKMIEEETEG